MNVLNAYTRPYQKIHRAETQVAYENMQGMWSQKRCDCIEMQKVQKQESQMEEKRTCKVNSFLLKNFD